jgi:hypothetical protein
MDVKPSLIFVMEKHRLKVFENRVLRRIFGPKGAKVAEGWKKLQNEQLHNWYFTYYY